MSADDVVNRTHKIQLVMTPEQHKQMLCNAHANRFAYNWLLSVCQAEYHKWEEEHKYDPALKKPYLDKIDLQNRFALELRTGSIKYELPDELKGMGKPSSRAFKSGLYDAYNAYKLFFSGVCAFPRYKKKGHESFGSTQGHSYIRGRYLKVPCVAGKVKMKQHTRYSGNPYGYRFVLEYGIWFVCLDYRINKQDCEKVCKYPERVAGIDRGLKHVAVLASSDGSINIFDLPKAKLDKIYLETDRIQRRMSHAVKYSKNNEKRLNRLHRLHKKASDIILDCLHKYTTNVAENQGIVVLECLAVQSMVDHAEWKSLRKSLEHSIMSRVEEQLLYKMPGRVTYVDRFFPSTKMCSSCGHIQKVDIATRVYNCEACGNQLDRDVNAALNLLNTRWGTPNAPVTSKQKARSVRKRKHTKEDFDNL